MKIFFKKPKAQEMLDSKTYKGFYVNTKLLRDSLFVAIIIVGTMVGMFAVSAGQYAFNIILK